MSEPVLDVRDVSFSYDQGGRPTPALRHLSFSVERGEIAGVVGPSGCGKTTMLKVIAGLMAPDSGEVLVNGRASEGVQPEVGYIFQDPRLLPWRTVMENVMLPLEVQRLSKPQARLT